MSNVNGSSWRIMKVNKVFEIAKQENRPVEQVAIERYGSIQEFEEALKERDSTSDLKSIRAFKKARKSAFLVPDAIKQPQSNSVSISKLDVKTNLLSTDDLNILRARAIKANIINSKDKQELQDLYELELEKQAQESQEEAPKSRQKNQKQTEKVQEFDKFGNRIRYSDQTETTLQELVIQEKLSINISNKRDQDDCIYCFEESDVSIVATGSLTYLALPQTIDFIPGECFIIPKNHTNSIISVDSDCWEEVRNWIKCLIRMFAVDNLGVLFFETVVKKTSHTVINCIPVPADFYENSFGVFKDALLNSDEEWSTHPKVIDTTANGIRGSIVKNLDYFHVWFTPNEVFLINQGIGTYY